MQAPGGSQHEADLYSLLNLGPGATNDEIQKAYKSLSKIFHPDRLRARNPEASELAQETFVKIKAAHDVLCDPVYRFAYDQYGHEGVNYVRSCQQVKANQQLQQQLLLPMDIHLYGKLEMILQHEGEPQQLRAAIKMFKDAMERYKQQMKVVKQRLKDSAFTFQATIELPCAHHPQGAYAALESNRAIPYLELEQAEMECSIRTTNQRQAQNQQSSEQPQQPQRHIYSVTVGTSTQWEATGKSGAEVTLETDYQMSPTSKTRWNVELTAPVTKVQTKRSGPALRPIKMQISSTHEFASGTVMNAGVRGSNTSFASWEYFVTSFRKLSIGWLESPANQSHPTNVISRNMRGSFAMGMKMFTGQPLFGFVTVTTIPPPKTPKQQQQPHDTPANSSTAPSTLSSPWWLSTPELSVRAGFHPNPFHASIKYEEFGKPWASLSSSWSWSISNASSKVKVMLSTDLWGFFEDNDTTTIRTGVKHDLESGWVWLWEWEELDWTLKIPISLSISKNSVWIAAAMGTEATASDILHSSVGSLVASYIVMTVARSMLADWTTSEGVDSGAGSRKRQSKECSDATFNDKSQDSFRLDNDIDTPSGADGKQSLACQSLMSMVAAKKRTCEKTNGGLVIRLAKLALPSSQDYDADTDSPMTMTSPAQKSSQDLTDILQFWVRNGTLTLPPLSSQSAQNYYAIGGSWMDKTSSSSSAKAFDLSSSLSRISKHIQTKTFGMPSKPAGGSTASNTRRNRQDSYGLTIRYEFQGNLYELSVRGDEEIMLPHAKSLLLGNAETVT